MPAVTFQTSELFQLLAGDDGGVAVDDPCHALAAWGLCQRPLVQPIVSQLFIFNQQTPDTIIL